MTPQEEIQYLKSLLDNDDSYININNDKKIKAKIKELQDLIQQQEYQKKHPVNVTYLAYLKSYNLQHSKETEANFKIGFVFGVTTIIEAQNMSLDIDFEAFEKDLRKQPINLPQ